MVELRSLLTSAASIRVGRRMAGGTRVIQFHPIISRVPACESFCNTLLPNPCQRKTDREIEMKFGRGQTVTVNTSRWPEELLVETLSSLESSAMSTVIIVR
jgi:hypothetical protein